MEKWPAACEHLYVYLGMRAKKEGIGGTDKTYYDLYYCQKCLQQRKIKLEEYDETSSPLPLPEETS